MKMHWADFLIIESTAIVFALLKAGEDCLLGLSDFFLDALCFLHNSNSAMEI